MYKSYTYYISSFWDCFYALWGWIIASFILGLFCSTTEVIPFWILYLVPYELQDFPLCLMGTWTIPSPMWILVSASLVPCWCFCLFDFVLPASGSLYVHACTNQYLTEYLRGTFYRSLELSLAALHSSVLCLANSGCLGLSHLSVLSPQLMGITWLDLGPPSTWGVSWGSWNAQYTIPPLSGITVQCCLMSNIRKPLFLIFCTGV